MLRKILVAVSMLVLCFTFVAAETIKGKITKIDEKSVTIEAKGSDAKAYDLAKDCKFYKKTKDAAKEEVKAGDVKIGKKGSAAEITTNADNKVTEVIIVSKK
jgi:hypothetical protein